MPEHQLGVKGVSAAKEYGDTAEFCITCSKGKGKDLSKSIKLLMGQCISP